MCVLAFSASQSMFGGATAFNQPLISWDVSRVTDMGVRQGSLLLDPPPLHSVGISSQQLGL